MQRIDGKKMKELLEKRQACAVDVDTKKDFQQNHILGAINIPYNSKEFTQKVSQKMSKKNQDVVIVGNSRLSAQMQGLCSELESAGYQNVYQYSAGPSEWQSAGLKIQGQA